MVGGARVSLLKVFGTVHLPDSTSEAVSSNGWKWESSDKTVFVGQQGQVSLLVIGAHAQSG